MKTLVSLLFCFLQLSVIAQSKIKSDYLVKANGDTLYGKVSFRDSDRFNPKDLKKIRLIDLEGKKKKYKKEDVVAFRSDDRVYEGFWLNQTSERIQLVNPIYNIDSDNGEWQFLRVIIKGQLSHYQLEWYEQGESRLHSMDLLKKNSDDFLIRATQGIFGLKKQVLKAYFSECSELAKKIENKEIKDVQGVVTFFDDNCLN